MANATIPTIQINEGNVGIGTVNPLTKLHITGATDANIIRIENTVTALSLGDTIGAIQFFNNDTTDNSPNVAASIYATAGASGGSGSLRFKTKEPGTEGDPATTTMIVTNGGRVGIGTTTPGYKLQVGDTGAGDGNIAMKANGSGADAGAKLTFNMDVGGGNTNSHIAQIVPISYDSLSSGTHSSLNFKVGVWNNNADAGVSRMTILSNGRVGIGTTDPGAKLDIAATNSTLAISYGNTVPNNPLHTNYYGGFTGIGMDSATAGVRIVGDTSTLVMDAGYYTSATPQHANWNSLLRVLSNGNVGIGVTSPTLGRLQIDGASPTLAINSSNNTDSTLFMLRNSGSNGIALLKVRDGGHLSFDTGATGAGQSEKMRINSDGTVGIGPSALDTAGGDRLHVDGTLRVGPYFSLNDRDFIKLVPNGTDTKIISPNERFHIENTTGDIILNAGGNVGIGTTSPGAKLEIVDTTSRQGTTASLIIEGRQDGAANVLTLRSKDYSAPTVAIGANHGAIMRWQGFDGSDFENMGYIFVGADGQSVANADAPSYMSFGTSADGSSSPTEKMRITSGGNVGIGTDSPGSELEVDGEITTTTITYDEPGDSSAYNGEIVYFGDFESGIIGGGTLMSLGNNGGGGMRWYKAADNTAQRATGLLGIALGTSASAGLLVRGIAKNTAWSGFTAGDKLYLSLTSGAISNSITSDTNDFVRIIGYALGGSKIYFCPDNTYIQNS